VKRVADLIWEILKNYTDYVFMLPGGGAMYLVDALGKSGLKYVAHIHEQGAGFAALGYARTSGKLGVCLVTSGPGATNALTACAAAWTDSFPVLFISGQTSTDTLIGNSGLRTRGVQQVNIIPMVKPITKWAVTAQNGGDAIICLNNLIEITRRGRHGPCWLDIPLDVQGEVIE